MSLVKLFDFEEGDFSEFDNAPTGTALSINSSSPINGSFDLQVDTAGTFTGGGNYNLFEFVDSGALRLAFRVDIGTLDLGAGDTYNIWHLQPSTMGTLASLRFVENEALEIEIGEDGGGSGTLTSSGLSGVNLVELAITKPSSDVASDGVATLYINQVQVDQVTLLDFYDTFEDVTNGDLTWPGGFSGTPTGIFYMDDVALRDDNEVIFPAANTFRALGLAADSDRLYLTGLKDGVLSLYRYLLDTLAEDVTIPTFGAATDTEIDDLTHALLPVVKPGVTGWLYLFGRDGDDKQVQISDDSGDNFGDVSDGGWGSTKAVVALMPHPLRPDDLIAVFADDDIYRSSIIDDLTWVKQSDAPVTLRRAGRHLTAPGEMLLAGQAAGEVLYTHNFGVSFEDISPVIPGEFEGSPAATADDGYVTSGGGYTPSAAVIVVSNLAGVEWSMWVRIPDVALSSDKTITAAYVILTPDANYDATTITVIISGEDADDAVAPTDAADYVAKTRTTASVSWEIGSLTANMPANTPDLSAVIQEVVDRGGWASGNALQLLFDFDSAGGSVIKRFHAYAHASQPLLHVEYTGPTGIVNVIEVSL